MIIDKQTFIDSGEAEEVEEEETEEEKPCEFCGGSGTITRDFHDPGDYYGHGQTEEICICRIGDEDADMDDDS